MIVNRFGFSIVAAATGLLGLAAQEHASAQRQTPKPRPGLTVQQAKDAITLAREAMSELRKKTAGASNPGADTREYLIGLELVVPKEGAPPPPAAPEKKPAESAKEKAPGPRVVVTSYRYLDDTTVFTTVDLGTGRVVDVQTTQHLRTPLSDAEFEESAELAREKSDAVKELYARYGKEVSVYPQFSQFTVKDDPRVQRVVHLTYRVRNRELSYPRPEVNLTTLKVETPRPPGQRTGAK
jgi:hypothetical protein